PTCINCRHAIANAITTDISPEQGRSHDQHPACAADLPSSRLFRSRHPGMKHRTDPALASRGTGRHVAPKAPTEAHPATPRDAQNVTPPRGLKDKITWVAIGDLRPFPRNPRHHPEDQIARLMRSIARVWSSPILIVETRTLV